MVSHHHFVVARLRPDLRVRRSGHLAPGRHGRRDFGSRNFAARRDFASRTVRCVSAGRIDRRRCAASSDPSGCMVSSPPFLSVTAGRMELPRAHQGLVQRSKSRQRVKSAASSLPCSMSGPHRRPVRPYARPRRRGGAVRECGLFSRCLARGTTNRAARHGVAGSSAPATAGPSDRAR